MTSPRILRATRLLVPIAMTLFCISFAPLVYAACGANEFCNVLSSQFSSIPNFIAGALKALVIVALPIISLFIVYSGFLFVAARGNEAKLSEAKQNFVF